MFTQEQKKTLRENSSMKAFTFMLDDVTKLEVLTRLKEGGCDTKKGSVSALIRVLLTHFATTDDDDFLEFVFDEVHKEYLFTTKKNKRSTM
jgi:hypothetical protein